LAGAKWLRINGVGYDRIVFVNEHFLGILHILGIFKSAPNIMHNVSIANESKPRLLSHEYNAMIITLRQMADPKDHAGGGG